MLGLGGGFGQDVAQIATHPRLARAVDLRSFGQDCGQLGLQATNVRAELAQHERRHALAVLEQRSQQVLGVDLTRAVLASEALGPHDGLLRFFGQLVEVVHGCSAI